METGKKILLLIWIVASLSQNRAFGAGPLNPSWYIQPTQSSEALDSWQRRFDKIFEPWRVNDRNGLISALKEFDLRKGSAKNDKVFENRIMGFFRFTFFSPDVPTQDILEGAYYLWPLIDAQAEVIEVILNRSMNLNDFFSSIDTIKREAPAMFNELRRNRRLRTYVQKKFATYDASPEEVILLHKLTRVPQDCNSVLTQQAI